ncbi:unnamed protein product [Gordionus sp. m RMFG-2023]
MIPAQDTFQQKDAENQQSNCNIENQEQCIIVSLLHIRKKPDEELCRSKKRQVQSLIASISKYNSTENQDQCNIASTSLTVIYSKLRARKSHHHQNTTSGKTIKDTIPSSVIYCKIRARKLHHHQNTTSRKTIKDTTIIISYLWQTKSKEITSSNTTSSKTIKDTTIIISYLRQTTSKEITSSSKYHIEKNHQRHDHHHQLFKANYEQGNHLIKIPH